MTVRVHIPVRLVVEPSALRGAALDEVVDRLTEVLSEQWLYAQAVVQSDGFAGEPHLRPTHIHWHGPALNEIDAPERHEIEQLLRDVIRTATETILPATEDTVRAWQVQPRIDFTVRFDRFVQLVQRWWGSGYAHQQYGRAGEHYFDEVDASAWVVDVTRPVTLPQLLDSLVTMRDEQLGSGPYLLFRSHAVEQQLRALAPHDFARLPVLHGNEPVYPAGTAQHDAVIGADVRLIFVAAESPRPSTLPIVEFDAPYEITTPYRELASLGLLDHARIEMHYGAVDWDAFDRLHGDWGVTLRVQPFTVDRDVYDDLLHAAVIERACQDSPLASDVGWVFHVGRDDVAKLPRAIADRAHVRGTSAIAAHRPDEPEWRTGEIGFVVTPVMDDLAGRILAANHHEPTASEQADAERTRVQNKLLGLDEVYKLYLKFLDTAKEELRSPSGWKFGPIHRDSNAPGIGVQLQRLLLRYGFASIADFASHIAQFEHAFKDGAVRITLDLLAKYADKLRQESQRYQDRDIVNELHGKLAGFRAQYQDFAKNTQIYSEEIWNAQHNRDAEQRRLPGNAGRPATPTQRQRVAEQNITVARANAEVLIKILSKDYPIFAEDDLPVAKRIDKAKLAQASGPELAGVLLAHIADRIAVVAEARGQLEGNHELIYKMDKLMPFFYAEMGIQPGSIHDQIIQGKMHDDAITRLVVGLLLAIVAIALTVVSLGTATPAIVAAAAAAGVGGLGTYMAYDEYEQYTAARAMADAGFADDPHVLWLLLAIVGAGFDWAAAFKAVRALAPAARALANGGELLDFTQAVEALQKSKKLDEQIAAAANKAAAARKSYTAAKGALAAALGKAYSLPGPFTDPEVYHALVRMVAAKLEEAGYSLAAFIAELKQARLAAKLGELTPEELAKAKQAWEEGQRLANLVKDAALLEKLLSKVGDPAKLERLLKVFPAPELQGIVDKLKNAEQIVVMIDHVGSNSTGKIVRQWIVEGKIDKANNFLERMSAGVAKELAETTGLGAQSVIIDTNAAIALIKDADPALRATMQQGEIARVAQVRNLRQGTELRVGNVTVGEARGTLGLKGVPIVIERDSAEYIEILNELTAENVGKAGGFADRALVADAFFAKTDSLITANFLTSDISIVNRLAEMAGINVKELGGFPALVTNMAPPAQ